MGRCALCLVAVLASSWACTAGNAVQRDVSPERKPAPGPLCRNGVPSPLPSAGLPTDPGGKGSTLPPMEFDTTQNPSRTLTLSSYFEPCAEQSHLLVVRVSGNFCGTCRWHVTHTSELKALDVGSRLHFLDLLVSDAENAVWTPNYNAQRAEMQDAWRALIDAPDDVAVDAKHRFRDVLGRAAQLPLYVLVDRRTMKVMDALDDPSPEELRDALRSSLALADGLAVPPSEPRTLFDGLFDREEWDLVREMLSSPSPPPDPSNEYADNPDAAALGKALFFDPDLSPALDRLSCATCHDLSKALADGLPVSQGARRGDRNAPSLALAAHSPWQFWDGSADSLWMQAAAPFENDAELKSSRVWVAHRIVDHYRGEYHAAFGAKYPVPDLTDVPRSPAPWRELQYQVATKRDVLTRVLVNAAKAIAAFERTLYLTEEPLDRYASGDLGALTLAQKEGLAAFFRTGCAQCHFGPRLTDDAFHVLRWPTGGEQGARVTGRHEGVNRLGSAEFSRASRWSDVALPNHHGWAGADILWSMGAFRTPPLRGATHTAPYGHAGSFATLLDAVRAHGETLDEGSFLMTPVEPWLPAVDATTAAKITVFMDSLSGTPVVP